VTTCISLIRTDEVDDRVTVTTPESPPPDHVTRHVVVAVMVYRPPDRLRDGFV